MSFVTVCWLFVAAITIHNIEEALLLPEWSKSAGRWHAPVAASTFRFAVAVLTVLAPLCVGLALWQGKESLGAYLVCGYALAMLLNVVVPHLAGSLALGRYVPGTASAVLLNFPATTWLLHEAFAQSYISTERFLVAGPMVVIGLVALIPALFWFGEHGPCKWLRP